MSAPSGRAAGRGGAGGRTRSRAPRKINVMVTGVTSTLGRQLTHRLYHDVRVGKILGVAFEDRPAWFDRFDKDRFVYAKTNILKYRELKNLFRSKEFKSTHVNAVVHLAFISQSPEQAPYVHGLNVDGTKRLLDECIEARGIRKFVFKSSDVVYKLRPNGPVYLDENAELNHDVDVDAWIKDRVDADMICRAKMDARKLKVVVLRVSIMIGGHPKVRLNAYFDAPLQFRELGFNPLINLVHISDVIQAIELSLYKDVKGIFNIAGGDTAPISALAERARAVILPIPSPLLKPANWLMRRFGKSRYYYPVDHDRMRYSGLLDISKASKILDYKPHCFLENCPPKSTHH